MKANITTRPQVVRTPEWPHHPHEDELQLYRDLTYNTSKLFLSHALCLVRHSEAFAAPDEARTSYEQLLQTVFTELIQWLPHRSVTIERGEVFYGDETRTKVLSISEIKGVSGNSVRALRHQRMVDLGWMLSGVQFRGVCNKLNGQNFYCMAFELRWKPDRRQPGDVRDHALITYHVGEAGRRSTKDSAEQIVAPAREPVPRGWDKAWW